MKFLSSTLSILLLVTIVLFSSKTLYSEPYTSAFDRYGNICWDDEQARLDNFAIHLNKLTSTRGYIAVVSGRSSCVDEAKYRAKRAKDWLVKRGVEAKRILIKDAGYETEVNTVLWVVPSGVSLPESNSALKKTEVSIHKCVDKVFARVLCLDQK